MVDSRKGLAAMTPDTGGRETVEQKVDALSASVDARFDAVDKRFEAVDKRFDTVDKRFDAVDKRFDDVTEALVEQRQYTEFAFDRLAGEMREGFNRLERKLDQFIDVQLKTNQLVDRRLQALESGTDQR
jgi:uncharacterized protein YicC (UPF0701 family)